MNTALLVGATWLHLLATVTVIGLYLLTFFVTTPASHKAAVPQIGVIVDIYRRAKPLVLGAWVVFMLSGVTLMLVDPQYLGIGRFNNAWSVLMLVKHIAVIPMILMTGYIHCCPFIGVMKPLDIALTRGRDSEVERLMGVLRSRERITMLLGVIVLALTAAAEAV
jgi:uncharacterized membrane protein